METKSRSLGEALEAAHLGAHILRKLISDMERTLLCVDTLIAAAVKEPDVTKATVLAENAAQQSYREQESFVKAFTDAMKDVECCEDEEDSEE
jgi:hypothetical protein